MICVPSDLKFRLWHEEGYGYDPGPIKHGLYLFSDNKKQLDEFVRENSGEDMTLSELVKCLRTCQFVFIGALQYINSFGDYISVGLEDNQYAYAYLLEGIIVEAMNTKGEQYV